MSFALLIVFEAVAVLYFLYLCTYAALNRVLTRGHWRLARLLAPVGHVLPRGHQWLTHVNLLTLREIHGVDAAAAAAQKALTDPHASYVIRNLSIDVLISAGRYRAALAAAPAPRMPTSFRDSMALCLIQINLAEAEYNLGRWTEAARRLEGLELGAWPFAITRAGLLGQRAWVAAHEGRGKDALDLCEAVKPSWLPKIYRAEYFFTRAAALLSLGQLDHADACARTGEQAALRVSSRRNALFLRARIAAARGEWAVAERLCRTAAASRYQGQGGDGLLLWADALEQLGRPEEAGQALRLVIERDPESAAAATAAVRLGKSGTRAVAT